MRVIKRGSPEYNKLKAKMKPTSYRDGGIEAFLSGRNVTGVKSGVNQPLLDEVEKSEYLNFPDGVTSKVVGKTHEQGGEKMDLPGGTKVLSDNIKVGAKNKESLSDIFDIKIKAGDTFATVMDKLRKSTGIEEILKAQEDNYRALKKNKEVQDDKTRKLNERYLGSKIFDTEQELQQARGAEDFVFEILFNMQEQRKASKEKNIRVDDSPEDEGEEVQVMRDGGKLKAGGHNFSGYNKPIRTPNHPKKSHAVLAKEGDKVRLIRFGQQGVKGAGSSPKTDKQKARQKSFKARHASNIKKGKMSAAYWADKVKWDDGGEKEYQNGGATFSTPSSQGAALPDSMTPPPAPNTPPAAPIPMAGGTFNLRQASPELPPPWRMTPSARNTPPAAPRRSRTPARRRPSPAPNTPPAAPSPTRAGAPAPRSSRTPGFYPIIVDPGIEGVSVSEGAPLDVTTTDRMQRQLRPGEYGSGQYNLTREDLWNRNQSWISELSEADQRDIRQGIESGDALPFQQAYTNYIITTAKDLGLDDNQINQIVTSVGFGSQDMGFAGVQGMDRKFGDYTLSRSPIDWSGFGQPAEPEPAPEEPAPEEPEVEEEEDDLGELNIDQSPRGEGVRFLDVPRRVPPTPLLVGPALTTPTRSVTPVKLSPEEAIRESNRAFRAARDTVSQMPGAQTASNIANLLAVTQGSNNQAVTETNRTNAQLKQQADLANLQTTQQNDLLRARLGQAYGQEATQALSNTRDDFRTFLETVYGDFDSARREMRELNMIDALSDNFTFDQMGNVIFSGSDPIPMPQRGTPQGAGLSESDMEAYLGRMLIKALREGTIQ